tara:strand:- start:153 stop:2156 length:2004 start_codon:yes stop_codon:yes gene_type:complete
MAKKISANLSSDQSIVVSRFQIDPANFTLSSLPDTSITSPVNGNFLSYYNNNWVNVDATTARTNLGLGSLATLNSLAFADLTDKPTTITGYGITDAVTSVDGSTGVVTTLQLGTSSTTALAGDTAIPDVSNFITASSTESLTNKTNLSIFNNTKGATQITTGADADFLFTTIHDENHPDYVAPGNFSVLGTNSNASITTKNLSLTSGSTGTMTFMSLSNSIPMSISGIGGINLSPAIGSVQILKQINHAADFSQANTNLFLYDTTTSAINSGSSIVFGAKYDSTTYATFLSEGPYIASYKVNATDNDYSFGLKFATIKNGATSQAVAMTIDEDQNVGINGTLDVNSDTLRLTETSASLPYPDTGLVPAIELYRNVGSPIAVHNIGHLRFYGNADNNVKTEYASINVEVKDTDAYSLISKMHFDVIDNDDDTSAPILTRAMTLDRGGVIASVPFTAYDAMTLSSTSDDENAGPTLFLYRNSPSVADSDVLGRIEFQGRKIINDGTLSQGGAETYAHIQAKVTDKTFDSEDGELILSTMTAGADTGVLTLSGVGSTFNNQLSVNGDINIVGGTILFKVIPQTVSGVLTAGASINQFRDSGSFTMPLANSITANHTLVAELPEKFAYNTPTITTSGSDVFRISTGTDTVISFNGPATLTFTSDGVSEWSL